MSSTETFVLSMTHPGVIGNITVYKETFGSDNPNHWNWIAYTTASGDRNKLAQGLWFRDYEQERHHHKVKDIVYYYVSRRLT